MHSIRALITIVTVSLFFLLQSCISVTDTLYIQDAEVYGPIMQPPVTFMNPDREKKINFSPKIYFNGTKRLKGQVSGHSKVNEFGRFSVDSTTDDAGFLHYIEKQNANNLEFEGKNLTWNTPDYLVGFDMDYYVTPKFILTGGLSLSEYDRRNLFGWKAGFGLGGFEGNFGLRFDAGFVWQEYAYNAETVVVRETSSWFDASKNEVFFFSDKGTTTNFNHYISLVLHYANQDAIVNPFISVAYTSQKILDYEPNSFTNGRLPFTMHDIEDLRGSARVSYLVLSPGASFYVTEDIKLVFAAKYFFAGNIENVSHETFIVPSLQLEFLF